MAKRITNEGVNVEYAITTNTYRLTTIGANVEYKVDVNYYRLTSIGVMVEYGPSEAPAARSYGPPAQMMG